MLPYQAGSEGSQFSAQQAGGPCVDVAAIDVWGFLLFYLHWSPVSHHQEPFSPGVLFLGVPLVVWRGRGPRVVETM